ncbi:uncharacterized protein LOC119098794 [Pollicipes pollicipes]|uniref:uncharacterized protein LOC119098794 n=1 Tax=Pollicipes pollicipes TaxID=41117 RepID=UPI001884E44E|nr:uncharacterized protein LOC119098794 [Pollicipes pollicipes]
MSEEIPSMFRLLCSPMKLERDRALDVLTRLLPALSQAEVDRLLTEAAAGLDDQDGSWHAHLGCLVCISTVLEVRQTQLPTDMLAQILQLCPSYLAHWGRPGVARELLAGCAACTSGDIPEREGTLASLMMSSLQAAEDDQDKWETSSTTSRDSADVFANTTSWTVLETCLRALERLIVASRLLVTQDLLDLVLPTLSHRNRFVREAGYGCIAAFLPPENPGPENDRDSCGAYAFGDQLSAAVARGLDDNWSRPLTPSGDGRCVRMAASVAARRFLCGLTPEERERHLPSLLPRICLSRCGRPDTPHAELRRQLTQLGL